MIDVLNLRAKRFLDMLALQSGPSAAHLSIDERRAAFANLMRFTAPSPAIGHVEDIVGPRRLRLYRPREKSQSALVFMHGGGLVAGSLDTHDALCRTLVAASGCHLIAVDYRLAPEHPFPLALDDVRAALTWVFDAAASLGLKYIGVGGDSAGGTLAVAAAAEWGARAQPKLAFQLLLCPILDFAGTTPSRNTFASPVVDQAMLDHDIALYTQGHVPRDDPRVSPLRAPRFDMMPPTFLHTAQCDPLRDEGAAYAARLRAAAVEVHDTCHGGMPHLFYGLAGVIPAANDAVQRIGAELAAWLARR